MGRACRAAALLLLFAAPAAAEMPHPLSPYSASAFVDVPETGPLSEAVTVLVETYGLAVGYGTDAKAELRAGQVLTRGDLVQWLSGAAERAMQEAGELEPGQLAGLPLVKPPLCSGSGWRPAADAKAVAGYDAGAPWADAFVNLVERYGAALVGADRRFTAAEPVTVAQAQACLAAFDPAIRIAGGKGAKLTRGEFAIGLGRALPVNSERTAVLAAAADEMRQARRRAERAAAENRMR